LELRDRLVHDLRRTAVRNLERAGVPRSVAMRLTGHKTEAVYRRYAIVAKSDLEEGVGKLAKLHGGEVTPPTKACPLSQLAADSDPNCPRAVGPGHGAVAFQDVAE
jgi:hypothetical protein